VRPIPIEFHVGPFQIHTYGVGLAVTFLFAAWYLGKRFRYASQPWRWVSGAALWIIVASIVGARVVHVLAHRRFYTQHPTEVVAIWHGGLSSFGGLLFGLPLGIWLAHRAVPGLSVARALDLAAPVLMAGWGLGRLLGPQLMIGGGGRRTTAWYGMEYAGTVGRRVPVPVFQAIECLAVFGALLAIERVWPQHPDGILIAMTAALWGLARFFDQFLWLGSPGHVDAVEVAGLTMSVFGLTCVLALVGRELGRRHMVRHTG
jgi:phosphatidylglycerol:prolipoprotein diacylglycerol transferase